MSTRPKEMGMDRALQGKIAAKYDLEIEAQVRQWFQSVIGIDIGTGMHNVEKSLHDGQTLLHFMQQLIEGCSNVPDRLRGKKLKVNTMNAPFKQMENIEIFLKNVEEFGVPRTSLFQVVDLYEGRNMANVLSCFLQLGTEAQRAMFNGPTIGPRPTEKHEVHFTEEQMKAGQCVIGLQAGSNKGASQAGMRSGQRHIADIKVGPGCKAGEAVIGLQAGTNQCASQAGMRMGSSRHIADLKVDDMCQGSNSVIGLQAGSNQGASQSGMSFGGQRHIADTKVGQASAEGQSVIGLQMGTNQFASQSGMNMGNTRHIVD